MSSYTKPLRIKTLNVVAEDVVQKIGHIEINLGEIGTGQLQNLTTNDLNKIEFKFRQIGEPVFVTNVIKDKVINCGYIQFIVTAINFPGNIPNGLREQLLTLFGLKAGQTPEIIAIPLQGSLDVCGVREDDDIEEFFDVEGVTACFTLSTGQPGEQSNELKVFVILEIKAAVKVRIVVSRFKLATADVCDVEDVTDFDECEKKCYSEDDADDEDDEDNEEDDD